MIVEDDLGMLLPNGMTLAQHMAKKIEMFARKCYKSEGRMTDDSYRTFPGRLFNTNRHTGIAEHRMISATFITDRGCCYDDKTEVLTLEGWKHFCNLSTSDKLACLSDSNELEWHTPSAIQSYDYSGNLLGFQSTGVDLLVTPNHNMWIFDSNKRSAKTKIWKFLRADELTTGIYKFNRTIKKWTGIHQIITIPQHITKQHQFPAITLTDKETNYFLELMGFWITDGSYSYGYVNGGHSGGRIIISQTKQRGVDRISYLLERLPFKWKYDSGANEFFIDNYRLMKYFETYFGTGAKTFTASVPNFIKEATSTQIQCFLDGVIAGDGSVTPFKENCTSHEVVYTASKQFTDDLQELFLKIGKSANIRTLKPRPSTPEKISWDKNVQYVVSVHNSVTSGNATLKRICAKKFATPEFYNGKVWCATVPYHRLYVRRNGIPVWCGNSHESVRHRMAAYLQESTRYVDYAKEGAVNKGVTYILPTWLNTDVANSSDAELEAWSEFVSDIRLDDNRYAKWRTKFNWKPEEARYWLPQGVKTEYAASLNLGSWWNFCSKRTPETAHPSMRQIAIPFHQYLVKHLPQFFEKLTDYVTSGDLFLHKGKWYPMAKIVINPYYDQVEFEEIYSE